MVPKGKDPTQTSIQLVHEACRDFGSREPLSERTGVGLTQGARAHSKLSAELSSVTRVVLASEA